MESRMREIRMSGLMRGSNGADIFVTLLSTLLLFRGLVMNWSEQSFTHYLNAVDETLEAYVRQYIEAQPESVEQIDFAFQIHIA